MLHTNISAFICLQVVKTNVGLLNIHNCKKMSSMKRYRQGAESNAAARFRDLPPRFKRQKSIPSPESDSSEVQKEQYQQNQKPKKYQGRFILGCSHQLSAESTKQGEMIPVKDKKAQKKGLINRPHLDVNQTHLDKQNQPVILSPMDSNLFNMVRSDDQQDSEGETLNPFSWHAQQPAWQGYGYEENCFSADKPVLQNSPWSADQMENTQQPNNVSPTSFEQSSSEQNLEPQTDYSEKDKRIIEMFKVLEKVADEKEKEDIENGTQGKTLVSHHLRMLMCAIDKYTEGIDEGEENSRSDEAPVEERSISPTSTPGSRRTTPPPPARTTPPPQIAPLTPRYRATTPPRANPSPSNLYMMPTPIMQQHAVPVSLPVANFHNGNVAYQQAQSCVPPFYQTSSYQFSPKMKSPQPWTPTNTPSWDLWSSPSPNTLDVFNMSGLNSSETADSTFALFDPLATDNYYGTRADELSRTPLYQRKI